VNAPDVAHIAAGAVEQPKEWVGGGNVGYGK